VWRWDNTEPFGSDLPNDDPGSTGTPFVFNLRFPGQYFDRETFTHYNVFRDYDPGIGRYVESDPIGVVVRRGMPLLQNVHRVEQPGDNGSQQKFLPSNPAYNHLYSYAVNSPVRFTDPMGLLCNDLNYWKCMGFATLLHEFDPALYWMYCIASSLECLLPGRLRSGYRINLCAASGQALHEPKLSTSAAVGMLRRNRLMH